MIDLLSPQAVLQAFGYIALFGFIFAESGLFLGFFLPGDSLLFTAGVFAFHGFLNVYIVVIGVIICAILGNQLGYWTGKRFGPGFFCKPGSFFRNPNYVEKAQAFYKKHGKKAVVFARFVPAVRTFAPIVAGTADMDYATFTVYNAIGGIMWSCLFVSAGYVLGSVLSPDVLSVIIVAILVIPLLPIVYEAWRAYRPKRK